MVGGWRDGDDDGWSLVVQGVEAAQSSLVRISYGDDQNNGWGTAPISGQTNPPDRKKPVIGTRPVSVQEP